MSVRETQPLSLEQAVDQIQILMFRLDNKDREIATLRRMFEYPPGDRLSLGSADKGSLKWSVEANGRVSLQSSMIGTFQLRPNEYLELSYKEGKVQLVRHPRKEA